MPKGFVFTAENTVNGFESLLTELRNGTYVVVQLAPKNTAWINFQSDEDETWTILEIIKKHLVREPKNGIAKDGDADGGYGRATVVDRDHGNLYNIDMRGWVGSGKNSIWEEC